MSAVVVVGSLNLDAFVRVPRLPSPGETVLGSGPTWLPGGKGANQAVAAARQGATTAMIGQVGDDDAGRSLIALLTAEGVDVSRVETAPGLATGTALITVDLSGANTIVVAPAANHALAAHHVDADVVSGAAVLVVQLEIPLETVVHALRIARDAGVTTMLNASPARALTLEVLGLVDVLVVNEREAEAIGPHAACPAVLVTRGADGVSVTEHGETVAVPSVAVEALDTTGAGDAFAGTLAAHLARGVPVTEAARTAAAAGALAVTRRGAIPSLPTAAELSAFLEEDRQ